MNILQKCSFVVIILSTFFIEGRKSTFRGLSQVHEKTFSQPMSRYIYSNPNKPDKRALFLAASGKDKKEYSFATHSIFQNSCNSIAIADEIIIDNNEKMVPNPLLNRSINHFALLTDRPLVVLENEPDRLYCFWDDKHAATVSFSEKDGVQSSIVALSSFEFSKLVEGKCFFCVVEFPTDQGTEYRLAAGDMSVKTDAIKDEHDQPKEKITVSLELWKSIKHGYKSEFLQFSGNIFFDDNVKVGYFPF